MSGLTIGKKLLRVLCVLLACLCLGACGNAEETSPLEQLSSSLSAEKTVPTAYALVVPYDCSAELLAEVRSVAQRLTAQTQVPSYVLSEQELVSLAEGEVGILVGWVRMTVSELAMRSLKADDYLCRWSEDGSWLLLGGKSDGACMAALERFCSEILPTATPSVLLHAKGGFSFTAAYAVDAVTLNGFDLHDYRIAYAETDAEALREIACTLRDRVAEQSGYLLSVVASSAAVGDRCITLQTEPLDGGRQAAGWDARDNGMVLFASDAFGVSLIAARFCERLLSKTADGLCACTVTGRQEEPYTCLPYTVASAALEHLLPFSSSDAVSAVTDAVQNGQADSLLLASIDAKSADYLKQSLSSYRVIGQAGALGLYDEEDAMTVRTVEVLDDSGLTMAIYRIAQGDNVFRVVHIGGRLTADASYALATWLRDEEEPTAVIAHWAENGHALSFTDAAELDTVMHEQYSAGGQSYRFVCYTDATRLSVERSASDDAIGYRALRLVRQSAF